MENMVSSTCRSYHGKRYRCVEQICETVSKMASASLRNGSQNGATLVGLTVVKRASVVNISMSKFDANKCSPRLRAKTYRAPGGLQIEDSSRGSLRSEPTKEENLLAKNNIAR